MLTEREIRRELDKIVRQGTDYIALLSKHNVIDSSIRLNLELTLFNWAFLCEESVKIHKSRDSREEEEAEV